MLEALLKEICQGGTLDVGKLAKRLDTSPQIVKAMLQHLQRSGILHDYESYDGACDGCGLSQDCDLNKKGASVRLWQYAQGAKDE